MELFAKCTVHKDACQGDEYKVCEGNRVVRDVIGMWAIKGGKGQHR